MLLNKKMVEEVKNVLYHHYLTDVAFPRSCGSVSMVLTYIFQTTTLSNNYEISCHRGHYRNDNEYEDCYCDESSFIFKRGDNLDNFPCLNCSCDYMVGHSWIEFKNKDTHAVTILDFTSIQFEDDFGDYHEDLISSNHNKISLYNYLSKHSKFIIEEEDIQFNRYISSERVYTGSHLIKAVQDTIDNNSCSDLSILLERLGYINKSE